jgi:hypothetical protein
VQYIESLDYFLLDMKNSCLFRYRTRTSIAGEEVLVGVDCEGAPLSWVAIQVALALLTGQDTVFSGTGAARELLLASLAGTEGGSAAGSCIRFASAGADDTDTAGAAAFSFVYTPLRLDDSTGQVIVPSISPSLAQLLCKDIQTLSYLQDKYGSHVSELMDEFDLLESEERDRFVVERSAYLLSQVRASSAYYARSLSSNDLGSAPVINGLTLLEVHASCIMQHGSCIMGG